MDVLCPQFTLNKAIWWLTFEHCQPKAPRAASLKALHWPALSLVLETPKSTHFLLSVIFLCVVHTFRVVYSYIWFFFSIQFFKPCSLTLSLTVWQTGLTEIILFKNKTCLYSKTIIYTETQKRGGWGWGWRRTTVSHLQQQVEYILHFEYSPRPQVFVSTGPGKRTLIQFIVIISWALTTSVRVSALYFSLTLWSHISQNKLSCLKLPTKMQRLSSLGCFTFVVTQLTDTFKVTNEGWQSSLSVATHY